MSASMDCRSTRGASGCRPRIAWLPMTMNSVSPVVPLDARRMCSRSARFILCENPRPLILWHEHCKAVALTTRRFALGKNVTSSPCPARGALAAAAGDEKELNDATREHDSQLVQLVEPHPRHRS